ncbi:MAG: AmmeMemoRadiSam system radical SAM enzyme [Deltaproteobacteria bacterium]|nr:AmmeMemoRadiSam system radical SAM enzyme [Deltaproteobacteria bacterium]
MTVGHEALFWKPLTGKRVGCVLCAQVCKLEDGEVGFCGARRNVGGELRSVSYGRLVAEHVDPIEKKPLFHYRPGSRSFSIATCGCNLRCDFCQNWSISQHREHGGDGCLEGEETPAERIVERAVAASCASISYTYTEPTVFYEYCRDVGVRAREAGLGNVFVTNGMMLPDVVDDAAATFLDAANVDLKAFTKGFYEDVCQGSLEGVKRGLERLVERGVWVEVTTLVVPGRNDSDGELRAIAKYLASLSRDLPWHLSRFHPDFEADGIEETPVGRLVAGRQIGVAEGLRHVYVGNARTGDGETTRCASCGEVLIRRVGFTAEVVGLEGGVCGKCGEGLAGRGLGEGKKKPPMDTDEHSAASGRNQSGPWPRSRVER